MIRYYNSGLYETFYTKYNIESDNESYSIDNIKFNKDLLAEYFKDSLREITGNAEKEEEIKQLIDDILTYNGACLKPLIFNEKIALECKLIPFTYNAVNLLANNDGVPVAPCGARVDAYQALTHGSIDEFSILFSEDYEDHFVRVVGEEIKNRVLIAIKSTNGTKPSENDTIGVYYK
jgi:hypothetical protein